METSITSICPSSTLEPSWIDSDTRLRLTYGRSPTPSSARIASCSNNPATAAALILSGAAAGGIAGNAIGGVAGWVADELSDF